MFNTSRKAVRSAHDKTDDIFLAAILPRVQGFRDSQLTKTRGRSIIFTTQVVYFRILVHFSCKSYFLHRGVYLPNKLYILLVSSIFFTISDIFFSISCIFPKISCMYLLDVLDILQQVFLSETARHILPWLSEPNLRDKHTCQLSWFIWESPGYEANLLVSCTGHQISWIKTTLNILKTLLHCRLKFHPQIKKIDFFQTRFTIS